MVPQQRRRIVIVLTFAMIFFLGLGLHAWLGYSYPNNKQNNSSKNNSESNNKSNNQALTLGARTNLPTVSPTASPTKTLSTSTQSPTQSPTQSATQSPTMTPNLASTQSVTTTSSTSKASTVTYYSIARTDRAGAAIKEMYLAHSHAWATNTTYGGACVDAIDWKKLVQKHGEKFRGKVDERIKERKQLIELMGLQDELKIACPTKDEIKQGKAVIWKSRNNFKKTMFPAEWMRYIQSKTTFPYKPRTNSTDEYIQVVIHIRRGDMTPCFSGDRYLPNVYFLKALDRYIPKYCDGPRPCNVTIFTQSDAYESLNDFQKLNYATVDVTTEPPTIWKDIINADVFIMSMSAFSFVPAVLNKFNNVVTPYSDIPAWNRIDGDIWYTGYKEQQELAKTCPPK